MPKAPDYCPNCGDEVPEDALTCPGCGADESTGWSDSAAFERLGVPDPDAVFDHGEFVKSEFGKSRTPFRRWQIFWVITACVALLVLLLWLI